MTFSDIAAGRLHNEFLLQPLAKPQDVVRRLGAVQAQEFAFAKWALGVRTKNTTDATVTKLFNDGKILRTHALRPTWHFVAPEDIRWIQSLTAPRVHAFNKYYYNQVNLDTEILKKGTELLTAALKGQQLTRKEVTQLYTDAGIDVAGLRLGLLIMYAELEAVVCSGAMQGKQHTYALVSERAPQAQDMPKAQAVKELTTRFFTAHGPATIRDFAWWSSLTVADIKTGIELAGLQGMVVEGQTFYFAKKARTTIPSPVVHLLPCYDEFLIAFKERRPSMQIKLDHTPDSNDLFYNFIMLDGQLIGGWKRTQTTKAFTIQLNPFKKLTAAETKALEAAATRLQNYVELPVQLQ
jgi:hypothetical protein